MLIFGNNFTYYYGMIQSDHKVVKLSSHHPNELPGETFTTHVIFHFDIHEIILVARKREPIIFNLESAQLSLREWSRKVRPSNCQLFVIDVIKHWIK